MADISEKFGLNYLVKEGGKMPEGFTLRDLFAAFALAGMLANSGYHFDGAEDDEERTAQAYSFADSMLEFRAQNSVEQRLRQAKTRKGGPTQRKGE